MSNLRAFVGHSFTDDDKEVVHDFLDFFNRVQGMGIGFVWEHAEPAAPKILSEKVLRLMEDKNLFIAICTAKEQVIDPQKLNPSIFNKNTLKIKSDSLNWKTSDWIIQEIGVAVGRKMDIIILLEEGLREPGGLQGDLEYIQFNRKEPSKCFNKILEMLTALSPRETLSKASTLETSESRAPEVIQGEKEERIEPTSSWGQSEYDFALFQAIFKDDKEQEQKIIATYNESKEGQIESNKASFEGLKYHLRILYGKGEYIEQLKALTSRYPENGDIAFYLGRAYEKYKDYEKAAVQYEKSADHSQDAEEKLIRYCKSAVAKCNSGFKNSEGWLLDKMRLWLADITNGEFILLKVLRDIADIENSNDKYLAFTERMLDLKPDDQDLRFSLAYKYAKLNNDDLALFHYLLIPDNDRGFGVWNNIGVANANLGIDGKAVDAYRESEKLGGTLAMSNIAHKFIKAGFLKEAEELCEKAVKIENYDKEVASAIISIKKTKDNEEQKQNKILKDVEKRRRFYIEYGKACIQKPSENYMGTWSGPECDLEIEIRGKSFTAKGSYQKKDSPHFGLANLYAGYPIKTEEKMVKVNIRYEGTIIGHGIEFKQYIEDDGKQPALLTGGPSKEGLMIINGDVKKIKVYEKGTRETEKIYELLRK